MMTWSDTTAYSRHQTRCYSCQLGEMPLSSAIVELAHAGKKSEMTHDNPEASPPAQLVLKMKQCASN